MKHTRQLLVATACACIFASCTSLERPHVVFTDRNEVSVSIKGSVPEQAARMNVGISNESFALVVRETEASRTDTDSVFASFGLKTESGENMGVSAARVFATGAAATEAAKRLGAVVKEVPPAE